MLYNSPPVFLYFLELCGPAAQLATSAAHRIIHGFRPSTLRQYTRMWSDFQAFKVAAGLLTPQVNTHIILAFMEYLHSNAQSKSNIANYLSAIRAFHIIYGFPTEPFRDKRIPLFLKSIQYSAPLTPKTQSLIDISMLQNIIQQSQTLPNPLVFKALYLTCFFSFLRLSNILPHTIQEQHSSL